MSVFLAIIAIWLAFNALLFVWLGVARSQQLSNLTWNNWRSALRALHDRRAV